MGKSTLAKGLASRTGGEVVDIGTIVRNEGLNKSYDASRRSYVPDERLVARKIRGLRSERDLVVATHFIGKMIQPSWVKLAIVLRLDPIVLYRRLRWKGRTKRSAWENTESELVDVCLIEAVKSLGRRKVFEIDTSSKSQFQIVLEALKIVSGNHSKATPSVNWLNHYDPISLRRQLGRRSSIS